MHIYLEITYFHMHLAKYLTTGDYLINGGEMVKNTCSTNQRSTCGLYMDGRAHKPNETFANGPNHHATGPRTHQSKPWREDWARRASQGLADPRSSPSGPPLSLPTINDGCDRFYWWKPSLGETHGHSREKMLF